MSRDSAMARIAVALAALDDAKDFCSAALQQFISPTDDPPDPSGADRQESLNDAFMSCHTAASALQVAMDEIGTMDKAELLVGEDDGVDDEDEG
ncbi:MAG: hypothetical protein ABH877_04315 [bacterium]